MASFEDGAAAALIGAVAGGALALGGSFWAKRLELTRGRRADLYEKMLPGLLAHLTYEMIDQVQQRRGQVLRAATVASRRDRRRAQRLGEALRKYEKAYIAVRQLPASRLGSDTPEESGYLEAQSAAIKGTEAYIRWLGERF